MRLWIDDVRPAPEGYVQFNTVDVAKAYIESVESLARRGYHQYSIELIDIDHDAGDFACYGGDYIRLLDWLEETGRNYPIHIHSANAVGIENMRRIIERNGWKEVF